MDPAELEAPSSPVRVRLAAIRDVLNALYDAKQEQDYAGQPGAGRGVWLTYGLWKAVARQLNSQVREIIEWEKLLLASRQELEDFARHVDQQQEAVQRKERSYEAQVVALKDELEGRLQEHRERQQIWDRQKSDLESQADHFLRLVEEREGVKAANDSLAQRLAATKREVAAAQRQAAQAEEQAQEARKKLDYFMDKSAHGLTQRDALSAQVLDLQAALTEARAQAAELRATVAQRQQPVHEVLEDLHRAKADNRRLVALLATTPQFQRLAADMAEGCGLHYLPLEEVLLQAGDVQGLYPQLTDRKVLEDASVPAAATVGGAASAGASGRAASSAGPAAGREEDPPDALPWVAEAAEAYHWVPRAALDAGAELVRKYMPGLPRSQLLHLIAELNKVWRQREVKRLQAVRAWHAAQVAELHSHYKQRAPYEAVVAGQKLVDLKRQLRTQAQHSKMLQSRSKDQEQQAAEDTKVILEMGLGSISSLAKDVHTLTARNKALARSLAKARAKASSQQATSLCARCLQQLLDPHSDTAPQLLAAGALPWGGLQPQQAGGVLGSRRVAAGKAQKAKPRLQQVQQRVSDAGVRGSGAAGAAGRQAVEDNDVEELRTLPRPSGASAASTTRPLLRGPAAATTSVASEMGTLRWEPAPGPAPVSSTGGAGGEPPASAPAAASRAAAAGPLSAGAVPARPSVHTEDKAAASASDSGQGGTSGVQPFVATTATGGASSSSSGGGMIAAYEVVPPGGRLLVSTVAPVNVVVRFPRQDL